MTFTNAQEAKVRVMQKGAHPMRRKSARVQWCSKDSRSMIFV